MLAEEHALQCKIGVSHKLKSRTPQVMIVGDLNIAASPNDVHPSMDWARMYHSEEVAAFRALLADLTDVWRLQNPDTIDCYTVWDEKTSARSVNRVRLCLLSILFFILMF